MQLQGVSKQVMLIKMRGTWSQRLQFSFKIRLKMSHWDILKTFKALLKFAWGILI